MIEIKIDIEAKGKGRPIVTKKGIAFTPTATRRYEDYLKYAMSEQYKGELLDEPLELEIECLYLQNKTVRKRDKPVRKPRVTKPDCDNIIKSICDAGNKLIWRDDALIYKITFTKTNGAEGEKPFIKVKVKQFTGGE